MNNNAGIYIRLSVMDDYMKQRFESESVENQRIILNDYATRHNFNIVKEYVDDGYSGTNFDRPAFQEMLTDLKNKVIDTIIVKDLSRFGRDHIQTGYFIETYFPQMNIRFISLMENLDSQTQTDYNDNATFVMACNDYFSKQNSLRVRASLDLKKRQGKFVGGQAPFGYMKDPKDKNHLIPNPETAPTVKKIFELANKRKSSSEIAEYLNKNNYLTPSKYKNYKGQLRDDWDVSSVGKIIKNEVYLGHMIQSKSEKASYKSKKTVANPRSKWIIVKNTHEPLVKNNVFKSVQSSLLRTEETRHGREKKLLENLIYCKDCGCAITLSIRKGYLVGQCVKSSRGKHGSCSSHYITYNKFESIVLEEINKIKTIDIDNIKRVEIQKIIDRIFFDKDKNITIVFKSKKIKPIIIKY